MGGQELFTFEPPLTTDNITRIRDQMLHRIPVYDLEKRAYFESALESLVAYAIDTKHQSKNFSLNIGIFDPHFNPSHVDDSIWMKDRIWVKVKVLGGFGLAFRHRFMATQLGVARVDWKRKTYRVIKTVATKALIKAKVTISEQTEDALLNEFKEEAKQRASERMHKKEYSTEDMFEHLSKMTETDYLKIKTSGQIMELARLMFDALDRAGSDSLSGRDFLFFWKGLSERPIEDGLRLYERIVGKSKTVDFQQFSALFMAVMETLISETGERKTMFSVLRDFHISTGHSLRANLTFQPQHRGQILASVCIVNRWMSMKRDELLRLQDDRNRVSEVVGEMFQIVGAEEQGLTFHQYEILQAGFDLALYRLPISEPEEIILFQLYSSQAGTAVIPREKYIEFIQSELDNVIAFKQDWERARTLEDAVLRFGNDVYQVTIETLYRDYYSRYASGEEIKFNHWVRVSRCAYITDMSEVSHSKRYKTRNLTKLTTVAMDNLTAEKRANFTCPGKKYFQEIATQSLEQLNALVLEEYRLRAIAHLVFLVVYPYRREHDFSTFFLYGKYICETFQLSEEELLEFFNSSVSQDLLMREEEFITCLKLAIMNLRKNKSI